MNSIHIRPMVEALSSAKICPNFFFLYYTKKVGYHRSKRAEEMGGRGGNPKTGMSTRMGALYFAM
jgi:hypothetical protein